MYEIDKIRNKIICGDSLEELKKFPNESVDCIVTSPPYWGLRDYGVEGQIGLEPTLEDYLEKMLKITAELKRVLKKSGVFFLNWGDCYGGNNSRASFGGRAGFGNPRECVDKRPYPAKCMALQNYRALIRMVDEQGWILRNIIIWHKPNHMPSSVKDRFTNTYEPVFMLVKSKKYWFDLDAVRVPHKTENLKDWENTEFNKRGKGAIVKPNLLGKNPGDLWTIPTQPFPEAHFATFPEKLIEPMIKAGCPAEICKKCGKARERITKKEWDNPVKANRTGLKKDWHKVGASRMNEGEFPTGVKYYTIGWTDCGCNAGWKPGIVLDPFMGAGTTAVVAKKLGRDYIGIELNPDYVKMAERRIKKVEKSLFPC